MFCSAGSERHVEEFDWVYTWNKSILLYRNSNKKCRARERGMKNKVKKKWRNALSIVELKKRERATEEDTRR